MYRIEIRRNSLETTDRVTANARENSTRVGESVLPFPQPESGSSARAEANMFKARVHQPGPPSRCHTCGSLPNYTARGPRNFHKFRHRASKWLPVQRSDIVDNRHVARGEFNIAFAPFLVQTPPFPPRLHPLFTLALFHPLREQRCALLRATSCTPVQHPPASHPRTPRIVPRIVPKVFAGAAYSLRHARLPYELK